MNGQLVNILSKVLASEEEATTKEKVTQLDKGEG